MSNTAFLVESCQSNELSELTLKTLKTMQGAYTQASSHLCGKNLEFPQLHWLKKAISWRNVHYFLSYIYYKSN